MDLVRRLPYLLILMGSMISPPSSLATPGEVSSPQFRVESTTGGLIVEWHAPSPQFELATCAHRPTRGNRAPGPGLTDQLVVRIEHVACRVLQVPLKNPVLAVPGRGHAGFLKSTKQFCAPWLAHAYGGTKDSTADLMPYLRAFAKP